MVKGYLPIALPPPLLSAFAQTSLLFFFRPLKRILHSGRSYTNMETTYLPCCLSVSLASTFCKVHPTFVDACCTRNPAIYVVFQSMPQTRVLIGMEYREYKQYSKSKQRYLVQREEDLSCDDGSHARASLMPNQPPSSSHIAGLPHILGFGGGEKREEEIAPPPSSPRGYRFTDIPYIAGKR